MFSAILKLWVLTVVILHFVNLYTEMLFSRTIRTTIVRQAIYIGNLSRLAPVIYVYANLFQFLCHSEPVMAANR